MQSCRYLGRCAALGVEPCEMVLTRVVSICHLFYRTSTTNSATTNFIVIPITFSVAVATTTTTIGTFNSNVAIKIIVVAPTITVAITTTSTATSHTSAQHYSKVGRYLTTLHPTILHPPSEAPSLTQTPWPDPLTDL